MFKWINKKRFPLNSTVHVEYYAMSPLGRYKEKRIGKVVGYPSGFKLLVHVEDLTNYQTVDACDCTIILDPLAKYPPL